MEDSQIVELYWSRSEAAIAETEEKFGPYLSQISYRILNDREDSRECVNDTYIDAWNSMPPHRPQILATFLGKITRRISLDRWRSDHALKRGGGEVPLALEELGDCVSAASDVETEVQRLELRRSINGFLDGLGETERRVFLCRYWYFEPIQTIGERFGFSRSKVSSMLLRTRKKLKKHLSEEGYV